MMLRYCSKKKKTFHEGNEHVDTYFPVYQIQGTKHIKDKTLSFKAHLVKWEVLWLNKASKTQFHAHLLVADQKKKTNKKIIDKNGLAIKCLHH